MKLLSANEMVNAFQELVLEGESMNWICKGFIIYLLLGLSKSSLLLLENWASSSWGTGTLAVRGFKADLCRYPHTKLPESIHIHMRQRQLPPDQWTVGIYRYLGIRRRATANQKLPDRTGR